MSYDPSAHALWAKAWGKDWPKSSGKVSRSALFLDENMLTAYAHNQSVVGAADVDVKEETEWEYDCFCGMKSVVRACNGNRDAIPDVLIIRDEYVWLREAMEFGHLAEVTKMAVTGQPGSGMTVFLFYLLIHRLQRALPTAIQLRKDHFYYFDRNGVRIISTSAIVDVDEGPVVWALVDSNYDVHSPSAALINSGARVIQALPPQRDRCKEWLKQSHGTLVISELPRLLEIGAIVHEQGLNIARVGELVVKWGPCTGTIVDILRSVVEEEYLTRKAAYAAFTFCGNPLSFGFAPMLPVNTEGSTLFYIRPIRRLVPGQGHVRKTNLPNYFIPTAYLANIFNEANAMLTNNQALNLLDDLSSNLYTKTTSCWTYERTVHATLCNPSANALEIFCINDTRTIQPTSELLPATFIGLEQHIQKDSFYWVPFHSNFPGIDGVFADRDNFYAVQATKANEYTDPMAGVQKLWSSLPPNARTERSWNVVVFSNDRAVAEQHRIMFSRERVTLGTASTPVEAWACVFPPSVQAPGRRAIKRVKLESRRV